MRRLDLLDTSVVVELLQIPHESSRHEEAVEEFEQRRERGVELQLPVAAVVQAGAHVGRIDGGHHRRKCAVRLSRMIESTFEKSAPWSFTPLDWDSSFLSELVQPTDSRAPALAESLARDYLEIGDLLIVAEYRRVRSNLPVSVVDVDVWTYDAGLRGVIDDLRS